MQPDSQVAADQVTSEIETDVNIFADAEKHPLKPFSQAVLQFCEQELHEHADQIAQKPILEIPPTPDDRPLAHYFISSSHNTYLLSRQLFGTTSAQSYAHVLRHGARCVEIDVWPHPKGGNEPIVTHGHTFSKSVPFRDVCKVIGGGIGEKDWPVLISLECHVDVNTQRQLVDIMKEEWGSKLVDAAVENVTASEISPSQLYGRILLIVEYYPPAPTDVVADAESSASSSEYSESEEAQTLKELQARRMSSKEKKTISPELAALGVYAQSWKPGRNWLAEKLDPALHILINISESGIGKLLPDSLNPLITHSNTHLRRVFPKGTRIASSNLNPAILWHNGTHIAVLNWQKFDNGTQLNEAMFVGSPGWVLKPPRLLNTEDDNPSTSKGKLICKVFGVSGLSVPGDWKSKKLRTKIILVQSSGEQQWSSKVVHCENAGSEEVSPVWNEQTEMTFDDDQITFVKCIIESEGLLGSSALGIFCANLQYLQQGWRFVRLLTPSGKHSGATLLIAFDLVD